MASASRVRASCGGGGGGDDVAFLGEDGFEGVADFGFVVDDEDVVHKGSRGTRYEVRGDIGGFGRGVAFDVAGRRGVRR